MRLANAIRTAKRLGLEIEVREGTPVGKPLLYDIRKGPAVLWFATDAQGEVGGVSLGRNGQWAFYPSFKRGLAALLFRSYSGTRDGYHYAITTVYNPSNLAPTHYVYTTTGQEFTSAEPEFVALVEAAYDDPIARDMLLDWVESTPTREVRLDATAVSHV